MFVKHCSRSILLQVVIGLVVGVICGVGIPDLIMQTKPLGDGFIKLIKVLIALIVFYMVVDGTSGAGDLKKVGHIDLKSVIYFEIPTAITLVLGLVVAYNLDLGSGANTHLNELPAGDAALYTGRTQEIHGPVASLIDLIPTPVFSAFTENDILQVLPFSVLFSNALNLVGEQASGVARLINGFSRTVLRIMGMIVRLVPLGVFDAVAFTTTRYSVDPLSHLGTLVLVFCVTHLVFVMAVLGSVLHLSGVRILSFLRYFRGELMIMMDTASSDAVLPQVMRKPGHMDVRSSTMGLMIPTSYSFNLDGFSTCLTLAVAFIAHVTNTPLTMADLATTLPVSLMTSKGAHGIPGSALVILVATLTAVPTTLVADLVLVLPMDWFMGIGRALTNLIGNHMVTMTIARWENDVDMPRAQAVLGGRLEVPAKASGEPFRRSAVIGEGKLYG